MDAPELSRLFLDRVFRLHGFPQSIVTDRGSTFVSSFFTNLMKLCNVKMKPSTAYHPQTDGLTERTNRTLETYLRAFCSYQQDNWVDYLALAEFAFNNSINSSTRQSPFFANFGYHPTLELSISERSTNPSASSIAENLKIIHEELRAELNQANETTSEYYNRRHLPSPHFKIGDLVWLLRRNIKTTRPSDKLDYRRIGPFKILDTRGDVSYLLDLPPSLSRLHPVFHVSLLEPYHDPSIIENRVQSEPLRPIMLQMDSHDIASILNSRKIGRRYEYLVRWKDQPDSENSWIPYSEISSSLFPILETYHRRNPHAPHPPRFQFTHSSSNHPTSLNSIPQIPTTIQVYNQIRSDSPPPTPWMTSYEPPLFQTTSSGRRVHPPTRPDEEISTSKGG